VIKDPQKCFFLTTEIKISMVLTQLQGCAGEFGSVFLMYSNWTGQNQKLLQFRL